MERLWTSSLSCKAGDLSFEKVDEYCDVRARGQSSDGYKQLSLHYNGRDYCRCRANLPLEGHHANL